MHVCAFPSAEQVSKRTLDRKEIADVFKDLRARCVALIGTARECCPLGMSYPNAAISIRGAPTAIAYS